MNACAHPIRPARSHASKLQHCNGCPRAKRWARAIPTLCGIFISRVSVYSLVANCKYAWCMYKVVMLFACPSFCRAL